jgi:hypothetical protein
MIAVSTAAERGRPGRRAVVEADIVISVLNRLVFFAG